MVDSHGHLNLDPLYQDWQQHLDQAINAGVNHIIIPGTDLSSSQKAIEIASASKSCSAMVGIHPHLASDIQAGKLSLEDQTSSLTSLAKENPIVAIGETGLDYFRLEKDVQQIKDRQKHLFSAQLQLAKDLNLPVSIHVRDAQDDALEIIKQHNSHGVLHCFSGDQAYLEASLDLGLYISLAGNITFKNELSLGQLMTKVPLDRLLLETDAPYLNPNRGEFPNTPANVAKVYQFISDHLNIPLKDLVNQLQQNATKLFRI